MKGRLEVVHWRDAHYAKTEEEDFGPKDFVMQTVGWVTQPRSKVKWLRIVSERAPDGAPDRCITWVPLENVIKREVLHAVLGDHGGELPRSPVVEGS